MISYFDLFNWKSTFYINGKFIQPPLYSPIKLIEKDFYCGPVRSQSIGLSNDVKIMDFAKHAKHFCIKDRFKIIPLSFLDVQSTFQYVDPPPSCTQY